MSQSAWSRCPPPALGPGAHVLGRWQPATLADLTAHRQELSAALHDGARPPDAHEAAVEALTLLFEELVSNAVRHGTSPVVVEVRDVAGGWLVDVSDAAVDRPPSPAVDRDPARGGLGLYLTAALSTACGWIEDGGRKHVWAHIPHTHPDAAAPAPAAASAHRSDSRTGAPANRLVTHPGPGALAVGAGAVGTRDARS